MLILLIAVNFNFFIKKNKNVIRRIVVLERCVIFVDIDQVIDRVMCFANKMQCTLRRLSVAICLSYKFAFKSSFAATCHRFQINRRYSLPFEFAQLLLATTVHCV